MIGWSGGFIGAHLNIPGDVDCIGNRYIYSGKSIRARDIMDKNARGMIWDWIQWKHFLYRGDLNGDTGLSSQINTVQCEKGRTFKRVEIYQYVSF